MRFIIHLYLHLNPNIASSKNKDKRSLHNDKFTNFVKKYIIKLQENEYYDMITTYCYILPTQELISTLTEFLIKLKNPELRIKLITKSKNILPTVYQKYQEKLQINY